MTRLLEKINSPLDLRKLDRTQLPQVAEEIREIIKPCGLSPAKSKAIHGLSLLLIEEHDGKVPADMDALERLPGVGHKTASVVMVQSFDQPAFPVDTHIYRVTGRIGLRPDRMTVEQAHPHLEALFPTATYYAAHLNIIRLGREICTARRPYCERCPIVKLCDYGRNSMSLRGRSPKQSPRLTRQEIAPADSQPRLCAPLAPSRAIPCCGPSRWPTRPAPWRRARSRGGLSSSSRR